jgi:hypothetical protein
MAQAYPYSYPYNILQGQCLRALGFLAQVYKPFFFHMMFYSSLPLEHNCVKRFAVALNSSKRHSTCGKVRYNWLNSSLTFPLKLLIFDGKQLEAMILLTDNKTCYCD